MAISVFLVEQSTNTSVPALQVRRDYDVYDAEDYACGEQGEFDGHRVYHEGGMSR